MSKMWVDLKKEGHTLNWGSLTTIRNDIKVLNFNVAMPNKDGSSLFIWFIFLNQKISFSL